MKPNCYYLFLTALLALGWAAPVCAQSTFRIGLRAGANLASIAASTVDANLGGSQISASSSSILAWQAGLQAEWVLSPQVAIQPALVCSQKGAKATEDISNNFGSGAGGGSTYSFHTDAVARLLYVELPIHLVYAPTQYPGLQLLAGPYLAVGVGGEASLNYAVSSTDPNFQPSSGSTTVAMRYGDTFPDLSTYNSGSSSSNVGFVAIAQARRFDAGFNLGVGYRSGSWQAQLIYGLGLVNTQPAYTDPYAPQGSVSNASGDAAYHRVGQLVVGYFFGGNTK